MQEIIEDVFKALSNGDTKAANLLVNKLISQYNDNSEVFNLAGIVAAKQQNFDEALSCFNTACKLDPTRAEIHNNISNIYKRQGNMQQAIAKLHEALSHQPNHTDSYNNLGGIYYSTGQLIKARDVYQKALRLDSANHIAHFNLANCHIKLDEPLSAITHYKKALEYKPDYFDAKLNLCMSYISVKNYHAAIDDLVEVCKIYPENPDLLSHLAYAYLDTGKVSNAREYYQKACKLKEDATWFHNLAILYLQEPKDKNKALYYFQKSLDLNHNNPTAEHMVNAILGDGHHTSGKYSQDLFDQYAGYYNEHMVKKLKYNVPREMREFFNENKEETKSLSILDLGCGTGLSGVCFSDCSSLLVGIDISYQMLLHAKAMNGYDVLAQYDINLAICGQGTNQFEMIIAADVFCYLGALEDIFNKIVSAIKDKGYILFSVEATEKENYILQDTGRFAYNINYFHQICKQFNLIFVNHKKIVLRENDNQQVPGYIILLKS